MESQRKNTGLYVIIGVLVLVNLATLGAMWYFRPTLGPGFPFLPGPPQGRGGIEVILKEEINFSDEQMTAFYPLREKHKNQTEPILHDMRNLKEQLIITVKSNDDARANEISSQIGEKQKQLELNVFDHFKSIRNICSDKQKTKFDSFVNDMGKMLAQPMGQPPIGAPPMGAPQDGKVQPEDDINRKPPGRQEKNPTGIPER